MIVKFSGCLFECFVGACLFCMLSPPFFNQFESSLRTPRQSLRKYLTSFYFLTFVKGITLLRVGLISSAGCGAAVWSNAGMSAAGWDDEIWDDKD